MKKILIISIAFLIGAFIFSLIGHKAVKMTGNDKFCTSCHEWMDPMVKTYHEDIHGGNNAKGLKASCVSCHLPHESLFGYLVQKGKNGIVEVATMISDDADKKDWLANRKRREEYVYDSGCLSCHETIVENNTSSIQSKKMHALYAKSLKTDKKLTCVACHKSVGHDNLGKELYEIKNPPVGEWDLSKFDKKVKKQ